MSTNLLMRPIGFVASPYSNTRQIPKGFGAQHDAEGALEILATIRPIKNPDDVQVGETLDVG